MAYDDYEDKSFKIDENYFKVIIPDLDPGKDIPVEFRWQYSDNKYSEWSVAKILSVPQINRPEATNIVATWEGTNLKVTWDAPSLATSFQIYLTPSGLSPMSWSKAIDKSQTSQTFILSKEDIKINFGGVFRTNLTGVLKTTYIDNTTTGASFVIPPYVDSLCSASISDSDWTLTPIANGFTVAWKANSTLFPTYKYTEVYVSDSSSGTYTKEYSGLGPATIKVTTLATNYIKIKHISDSDCSSSFSNTRTVAAYDPIVTDITPPDEVTNVSAAWSGDDIIVSFNFPTSNIGKRFRIFLTNSGQTVFFDKYTTDTTSPASIKILSSELYGGFGEYYTSFTGVISSVDEYENKTTGVAFSVPEKANPLTGVTPTATVTAISNGYTVTWILPSGADYARVYEGTTSGFTPNDSTNLVYSGQSPAVIINTVYSQVYVKIKYFTQFGGYSNSSVGYSVTPIDAGMLSVIDNPVEIQTGGSILAGDTLTSGARLLLNETGMYLYDQSAIVGTGPTTQIIGNATSGSPTFITTNAKIANWNIYSNKIENSLGGGITKYAGLSPSGTYSFWAGSDTQGGDSTADFTVTPLGAVRAKNIQISGGTLDIGAASPLGFHVNSSGALTATGAMIYGTINATAGTFTGVINIGNADTNGQLALYAGTNKFEIGRLKNTDGTWANEIGIQGTNSGSTYFQLDTVNGIIVNKGSIGGWTVNSTTISKNYTSLNSDGSITAGTSGQFTVSSAGALTATGATILGTINASSGGFGTYTAQGVLDKGWKITSATIESTGQSSNYGKIILDGENGKISGGLVFGTKVIGSAFYIGSSDTSTDYIKSDGTFSLGGGKITGSSSSVTIAGASLILAGLSGGDDGTAGDPTVTSIINPAGLGGIADGRIVTGRAIWYGGNNTPTSSITSRYAFNNTFGGSQGYVGGVPRYTSSNPGNFSNGDLYMTIV